MSDGNKTGASHMATVRAFQARFGLEWLALLPAVTLAAYWLGGEGLMIALSLLAPVGLAVLGLVRRPAAPNPAFVDVDGFATETRIVSLMDHALAEAPVSGLSTCCLVIVFDDLNALQDQHGRLARDTVVSRSGERLGLVLRGGDAVARLEGGMFAVTLAPMRRFDLEAAIQLAVRLQTTATSPLAIDEMTVHPSVSVGFCLGARAPAPTGASLLDAARAAADEAARNGPGAIRAFLPEMTRRRTDRAMLRAGVEQALDEGQIRPWFQPQLSTDTGAISGFEALARWHHPERGIIPPIEFLPLIEDAGMAERLGEVILYGALSALTRWDKAGFKVPRVGVNFSASELRNPKLAEKLAWELDRFNLTPDRLSIEVLETVAAQSDDDVIVTNLAKIAQMGCGIDLDDFGTGQASISNIRRFAIKRIKIDRSFITRADTDPAQKQMVAAILSLSDRLGLETVAEGVETPGEHATVAQLGCGHVQGYGIARPMAVEETFGWIERHQKSLAKTLKLGRGGL